MKSLLLLYMVICCSCSGQKKDSLPSKWVNVDYSIVGDLNDSTNAKMKLKWSDGKATGRNQLVVTPKQDTVKVVMLVCDTTFIKDMTTQITLNVSTYSIGNRYANVWWQFGYALYEKANKWIMSPDGEIFIGTSYLDENKKPLPKSLIIWMSKEIK